MSQNLHDIVKSLVSGSEKEAWLTAGKLLSPYQKSIIKDNGWSLVKYTLMLYSNKEPLVSDVVILCKIIGIPVQPVIDKLI